MNTLRKTVISPVEMHMRRKRTLLYSKSMQNKGLFCRGPVTRGDPEKMMIPEIKCRSARHISAFIPD